MAKKIRNTKTAEFNRLSKRGPSVKRKIHSGTPGTVTGFGNPTRKGSGSLPKPSSVRRKG